MSMHTAALGAVAVAAAAAAAAAAALERALVRAPQGPHAARVGVVDAHLRARCGAHSEAPGKGVWQDGKGVWHAKVRGCSMLRYGGMALPLRNY